MKRNICVEKCSNEYILCMDDDDYYPPDSFLNRVKYLILSKKSLVCCTDIAYFDINKYISVISRPTLEYSLKDSEIS